MMQQGGEQGKQNLGGEEAPIAPSPSAHSWMETLVEDEGKFRITAKRAKESFFFSESCLFDSTVACD